eukprot:4518489-Pleurochrysis_carterae.AAC.1
MPRAGGEKSKLARERPRPSLVTTCGRASANAPIRLRREKAGSFFIGSRREGQRAPPRRRECMHESRGA